jgi:GTP cyclohydrolase I
MPDYRLAEWLGQLPHDAQALEELRRSEARIRRAYSELLDGYNQDPSQILNVTAKVDAYAGVVSVDHINFMSLCPHHFLPYYGQALVAYQPGTIITGLGKIPRLVRVLSRRLQIQEFLTRSIVHRFIEDISAKGAFAETNATHLCICGRGPLSPNATTTIRYGLGSLETWTPANPNVTED